MWLFRRRVDYERELPRLATKIRSTQLHLGQLQVSQRRVIGLFLLWAIGLYTSWTAWVLIQRSRRLQRLSVVVVGPFAIWLGRYALFRWYSWRISRQEASLSLLVERRQGLVEEYKQRTNYDKINELVADPMSQKSEGLAKEQPERLSSASPSPDTRASYHEPLPAEFGAVDPPAPQTRTWMDRIVDLVLGENEQSPNNRYALICSRCHAHNGLATFGQTPDQIVYRCPHCGQINGSYDGTDADGKSNSPNPAKASIPEPEPEQRRQEEAEEAAVSGSTITVSSS